MYPEHMQACACPVCGSPANQYRCPNKETYVSCRHCGSIEFSVLDGGDPEHVTPVEPEAELNEYQAALAADEAWSKELQRLFGKRAGDIRYTLEGRSGPILALLYAEYRRACDAWHAKQVAARSAPTEPPPAYERAPEHDKYTDAYAWRDRTTGQISYHFIGNDPNVCPFNAPPPHATMDEVVRLALATSHIPLPDEGRYRVHHTNPPCPCGEPSDHHPQRCSVIGQLMMQGPLPACEEGGEGVNWSERAIGLPLHWAV